MHAINTNVTAMTNYLHHALTFEKYVYIWSNSMQTVNQRMENIYATRQQLQHEQSTKARAKAALSHSDDRTQAYLSQETDRYEAKAKSKLRTYIVGIVVVLIIAIIAAVSLCSANADTLDMPPIIIVPLFIFVILILFVPFWSLLCLPSYFVNKNKASNSKDRIYQQGSIHTKQRQFQILEEEEKQIYRQLVTLDNDESALSVKQDQILTSLKAAQKSLAEIYALNVLPPKYRNLCAVATMHEYLTTRRCDTITGHGGIYDTYETEKIQLEQLRQMILMNQHLANIEDTQRHIYKELCKANASLTQIRSSLNDISATNREIARNTAITAEASQQTAANTSWLAYRAWANGF